MATAPQYTATPVISSGFVAVANGNLDGSGAVVDVITGAANGTRVDKVTIQCLNNTVAGLIRLYVAPPAINGRLIMEVPVTAIIISSTVPAFHADINLAGGIMLPPTYALQASTTQGVAFWVTAFGGNF